MALDFSNIYGLSQMKQNEAQDLNSIASRFAPLHEGLDIYAKAKKDKKAQDELDAKKKKGEVAQRMQQYIIDSWDSPTGEFEGIASEAEKARKASALMAPLSQEHSDAWLQHANELEKQNAELGFTKEQQDAKNLLEGRKLDLEQKKLDQPKDVKIESFKPLTIEDWKSIGASVANGTYAQTWADYTENGSNRLKSVLPSPDASNADKMRVVQTALKGDFVEGQTVAPKVALVGEDLKGSQLSNIGKGLSNKIEAVNAKQKEITGEQLNAPKDDVGGRIKFKGVPDEFDTQIEDAKTGYNKVEASISDIQRAMDQLKGIVDAGGKNPDGSFKDMGGFPLNTAIYAYNKIIDPQAVVRESDVNMATEANGVAGRLASLINFIQSSKTLPKEGVADMYNTIKIMDGVLSKAKNRAIKKYGSVALDTGVDARWIVGRNNRDKVYNSGLQQEGE